MVRTKLGLERTGRWKSERGREKEATEEPGAKRPRELKWLTHIGQRSSGAGEV